MGSPVFDSLGYTGGMRRGYTTGSCAAAAAKGAAMMLFSRETVSSVSITLPEDRASPFRLRNAPFPEQRPDVPCGRIQATTLMERTAC